MLAILMADRAFILLFYFYFFEGEGVPGCLYYFFNM